MPKRISSSRRAPRGAHEDVYERAPKRRSILRRLLSALLPRRVSDTIALAILSAAGIAVVVNAVAFQEAPRSSLETLITRDLQANAPNPQPRPADAPARDVGDLIQNIQRELSVRGYYNGAVDGVPGPRTEQAIRDFQKGKGGQNTLEPSDALLNLIKRTPVKGEVTKGDITGSIDGEGERKSLRVLSLQRALARLGYGPVRISGTFGPDTKEAIERFERDWKMPVTGLMTDNLFAKVAAVNGEPID
ncbi:MAG: peptidoglycan-binding protein [Xanthobacteraceae bacterium]|nr:peptidoglycan-binding protein [Xanthobacteraceae bacterium]